MIKVRDRKREYSTAADDRVWTKLGRNATRKERKEVAQQIIEFVAGKTRLGINALVGESRSQYLVRPRYIAAYAIHNITGLGVETIAEMFNRDRTTILHGLDRAPILMGQNEELAELYSGIAFKFLGVSQTGV